MLIDVLERVAVDTGLHATQQRAQLERILNIAAREIYQELECDRIYREVSCLVGTNKIVALPPQIGELRGLRQHSTELLTTVDALSPRYVNNTQGYKLNNWRDLGESPVHTLPTNVDAIRLYSPVLENATIVITGSTATAAFIAESVLVNVNPQFTTNLFATIKSITSFSTRTVDIIIKDTEEIEIAVLYCNQKSTRYKMVDVSELFFGVDSSDGETLMDVLYKEPLTKLSADTDSFPAGDVYDEAWYARAMSIHYAPIPNRLNDSNRFRMSSLMLLRNIKNGVEFGAIKKLEFGDNKYINAVRYPNHGYRWDGQWY